MTSEQVTRHYSVERDKRQRWGWNVILNGGKTVARCNSEMEARQVADALRLYASSNSLNNKLGRVQSELRRLADL